MKRAGRIKKLTLHKESLRRLIHRLTEQQLANALGGSAVDGGPLDVPTRTRMGENDDGC